MMIFLRTLLAISGVVLAAIILTTPGPQLIWAIIAGLMIGFAVELKDR